MSKFQKQLETLSNVEKRKLVNLHKHVKKTLDTFKGNSGIADFLLRQLMDNNIELVEEQKVVIEIVAKPIVTDSEW